eukprot:1764546-Rhodomonas_salina.2
MKLLRLVLLGSYTLNDAFVPLVSCGPLPIPSPSFCCPPASCFASSRQPALALRCVADSADSEVERRRKQYLRERAEEGANGKGESLYENKDPDVVPEYIARWGGADLAQEGPTRGALELMNDSEWAQEGWGTLRHDLHPRPLPFSSLTFPTKRLQSQPTSGLAKDLKTVPQILAARGVQSWSSELAFLPSHVRRLMRLPLLAPCEWQSSLRMTPERISSGSSSCRMPCGKLFSHHHPTESKTSAAVLQVANAEIEKATRHRLPAVSSGSVTVVTSVIKSPSTVTLSAVHLQHPNTAEPRQRVLRRPGSRYSPRL